MLLRMTCRTLALTNILVQMWVNVRGVSFLCYPVKCPAYIPMSASFISYWIWCTFVSECIITYGRMQCIYPSISSSYSNNNAIHHIDSEYALTYMGKSGPYRKIDLWIMLFLGIRLNMNYQHWIIPRLLTFLAPRSPFLIIKTHLKAVPPFYRVILCDIRQEMFVQTDISWAST